MQNFRFKTMLAMAVLAVALAALTPAHAQEKPEIFVQLGHSGSVDSVAYSPDGKYALSGSGINIKLWEVGSGKEIRNFTGHLEAIYSVTFSPNGHYALSGSGDKTLKLWDVETGKEIRTFSGHSYDVRSVAFSPDGKYILSGSGDKTLKLWEVGTGIEIRTFLGHLEAVPSVAYSLDGRYALSGSYDKTLKLWDVLTGKEIRTFSGHSDSIWAVAFSPDGRYALSGSYDKTLKLWDVASGREVHTFSGHSDVVWTVAFSPDGKYVLSGGRGAPADAVSRPDKTLKLWDVKTGKEIKSFQVDFDDITSLVFSPDGKYALSGCFDKKMKLWNIASGKELIVYTGYSDEIFDTNLSHDGNYALSGYQNGTLVLWDIASGKRIRSITGLSEFEVFVAFSPDGKYALSGSTTFKRQNTLTFWDIKTGREIRSFSGPEGSLRSLEFSSNGKYVLSETLGEDGDHYLTIQDAKSGRVIESSDYELLGSGNDNQTVNNLKYMICGSDRNCITLCDISSRKEIAKMVNFNDGEWLTITPEGYYNASPNGDKYLNVRMGNNVYGIDQYKAKYFRPDIVQLALQLGDTQKAIAQLKGDTEGLKASEQPPKVWFVSPQDQYETDRTEIQIQVKTEDIADEAESVTFYVNGRPLSTEKKTVCPVTEGAKVKEFSKQVPLVLGNNFIEAEARGKAGATQKKMIMVIRKGSDKKLPVLWYFGAGVSEHSLSMLSLRYAAKDVSGLADALKLQKDRAYSDVNIRTLTDAEATRGNIMDGAESFFASAKQEDVAILFVSGHGMNSASGYYFIAHDSNPDKLSSTGVSAEFFSNVLKTVKCSVLLFADTCHSGNITGNENWKNQADADPNEFLRGAADNGVIVFSSSSGSSISREDPSWGHGAFAKALIDGIMGEAAFMENKVDIASLQTYVKTTVLKLTDNTQQPVIPKLTGAGAFLDLVLAKKES